MIPKMFVACLVFVFAAIGALVSPEVAVANGGRGIGPARAGAGAIVLNRQTVRSNRAASLEFRQRNVDALRLQNAIRAQQLRVYARPNAIVIPQPQAIIVPSYGAVRVQSLGLIPRSCR